MGSLFATDGKLVCRRQRQRLRHRKNDTIQEVIETPPPEMVQKMVGPWGLEPQTSTVSIRQAVTEAMSRSERKPHTLHYLAPVRTPSV